MKMDIGISEMQCKETNESLCHFLADTYALYVKTQFCHWNVKGVLFSSVHSMTETQYKDLAEAVDVIAERIRALGGVAPGSFSEFKKLTSIRESETVRSAQDMISDLIYCNEQVAKSARNAFIVAEKAIDQATADILTQRMRVHEKNAWMLRSIAES